ncbi:lectin L6-like isoform X2 [Branchiostoma lanceolatum]|uniref:lectin L6-like isoform X2 n=1 Tax=Branchiostoma lanceolatum TaxID=7740 RepID=UPI0034546A96
MAAFPAIFVVLLALGAADASIAGVLWKPVSGNLKYVSVGASGVWGVNRGGYIFYRVGTYGNEVSSGSSWQPVRPGISPNNPTGTGWQRINGKLKMVNVSPTSNAVWGVDRNNAIFKWKGSRWQNIRPGKLTFVSVGKSGVWGVDSDGKVYYRTGTAFNENSAGTGWQKVPGSTLLVQISVGDRVVWGVTRNRQIYVRRGITQDNPMGTSWQSVRGQMEAVHVSSSSNQVWGVASGQIYQRTGISGDWFKRALEIKETLQDLRDILEEADADVEEAREMEDMGEDAGMDEDVEKEMRELEDMAGDEE